MWRAHRCVRDAAHVVALHARYADRGLVVVGIHTPEFPFERSMENVHAALARFGITYPVAQDNGYATWKAWNNHSWPAQYLVDQQGTVLLSTSAKASTTRRKMPSARCSRSRTSGARAPRHSARRPARPVDACAPRHNRRDRAFVAISPAAPPFAGDIPWLCRREAEQHAGPRDCYPEIALQKGAGMMHVRERVFGQLSAKRALVYLRRGRGWIPHEARMVTPVVVILRCHTSARAITQSAIPCG